MIDVHMVHQSAQEGRHFLTRYDPVRIILAVADGGRHTHLSR
jgi:hypothetical protein